VCGLKRDIVYKNDEVYNLVRALDSNVIAQQQTASGTWAKMSRRNVFLHSKNTPERKDYIMENLVVTVKE
jgi:hypothetical protein